MASDEATALRDALEVSYVDTVEIVAVLSTCSVQVADMYRMKEHDVYRECIVNLVNKDKVTLCYFPNITHGCAFT